MNGCRYDWMPGRRWEWLACVRHRHSNEASSSVWVAGQTLEQMRELGVLSGQALSDAELLWILANHCAYRHAGCDAQQQSRPEACLEADHRAL